MNKTIGILAHVDAGKTTFSEQLLYHTNSIKQRGRVDHQSSFLDSHEIEKQRGITIFADQAILEYEQSLYYLIDTPGHVDFSPEMERAIQVMDAAIIVISAVEGVEAHTETVWELLKKHQVPTFFFINKVDRTGANVELVIDEIRHQLTGDVCAVTTSIATGTMNDDVIECIAERDEGLLERYMQQGYEWETWSTKMRKMIQSCEIYPCFTGSALQDIGVKEFIENLDFLTVTDYRNELAFAGQVYKIRYDESGTRVTYIKVLSGVLSVRDEIDYGDGEQEKVTQMRRYNGKLFQQINQAVAGEIIALTGLTKAVVGDGLGVLQEKATYEMFPLLRSKVVFEAAINVKESLKYFRILEAEDPSLNVIWEEKLQHIQLHVMGKIQLEVLEQVVFDRFGLHITFEKPEIIYKETISAETVGYGHFEPLRHYAEVHLRIEPAGRNSGISFESVCHADHLTVGLQNLVGQHLLEKEHHGLLTGSALTDMKVTLLTGRDHNKHTHGGDFREATLRALRQGLEKVENILLEPYYQFKIIVHIEQMGRVLSDIQSAYGSFDPPMTDGDKAILVGKVPVDTFMEYSSTLASFTQGKGRIQLTFAGYFPCHNEREVIERISYDKNADPEYSSSSVFCAKGTGYTVKWDEAEQMMHC
ncbi:elongation factor G [Paenibacillus endoradicis]|uniref:elongation factor G n=1 Tax=Paenibacillus endoradicis TaxID=2972487 RepID=UPI002158DCA5|nr:TetM/TetW/TetO/TetS family tetracycline resistance ribosomal protection protein [Paenibacillus endoradicis]MCR8656393.1 TetM/TetW/TetO/TetS family tetracycline resistance ribosomal protection protein [Paenibacillus endoradicis]